MPDFETHCKISKLRTGEEFRELHTWMDEPKNYLGPDHRIERHSFHNGYKNFVEGKWGKKAVVEWLFHIALDNLDTANKFAVNTYSRGFDDIRIKFDGKELSSCEFTKTYPNSFRVSKIELREKIEKIPEKEGLTKEELMILLGFDETLAEQMANEKE